MSEEDEEEAQRFYKAVNAAYAAGKRDTIETIRKWLTTTADRGDHEFGWKDEVRAELDEL